MKQTSAKNWGSTSKGQGTISEGYVLSQGHPGHLHPQQLGGIGGGKVRKGGASRAGGEAARVRPMQWLWTWLGFVGKTCCHCHLSPVLGTDCAKSLWLAVA